MDPHGDPIPNKEGEQIHTVTKPLTDMTEGEGGIIMHIEDEPPEIYSSISALNLHIGTYVKVIKRYNTEIIVEGGGTTTSLPLRLAGNIFLSEPVEELITAGLCRLSELKMNEEAVIAGISKGMRGQQRRRLLDFGFVPGTKISVRLASIGNDPVAYDIRSTTVALRKQQADLVFVKKFNGGADYGRN
jgi:DtxR family Mn-dependent transcriptional regulator